MNVKELPRQKNKNSMIYITIKIWGYEFNMLLDSGASHSFVSETVAKALPLPVKDEPSQSVQLPDGRNLTANRYALERMEIAGRQFQKVKLHVIEMNPSIILGCDFLNRMRAELNFEDFTATLWC